MASATSPIVEVLAELQRALGRLGLRWYLFGAQAAILYGAARLTADVDVTVDLGPRAAAELVDALTAAGFTPRVADLAAFIDSTKVAPVLHRRTRMPVDVVVAGPGLEELFFARVEERSVAGLLVPVASAEDIVVMKILAGRALDLEDVTAIVRVQGKDLGVEQIRGTLRDVETALGRRDLVSELDRVVARAARSGTGGQPGVG